MELTPRVCPRIGSPAEAGSVDAFTALALLKGIKGEFDKVAEAWLAALERRLAADPAKVLVPRQRTTGQLVLAFGPTHYLVRAAMECDRNGDEAGERFWGALHLYRRQPELPAGEGRPAEAGQDWDFVSVVGFFDAAGAFEDDDGTFPAPAEARVHEAIARAVYEAETEEPEDDEDEELELDEEL